MKSTISIPIEKMEKHVYLIRKQKVILDLDLAALFGIPIINIKRAVKSNMNSFPAGLMFSLNKDELDKLKRKISTSSLGGMRYAPMAFTREGVDMLSSVLNSEINQAI